MTKKLTYEASKKPRCITMLSNKERRVSSEEFGNCYKEALPERRLTSRINKLGLKKIDQGNQIPCK